MKRTNAITPYDEDNDSDTEIEMTTLLHEGEGLVLRYLYLSCVVLSRSVLPCCVGSSCVVVRYLVLPCLVLSLPCLCLYDNTRYLPCLDLALILSRVVLSSYRV
jgi:hypothetical protein